MSANFMTKQHAAGIALAAKRGQLKPSDLEGAAKSLHDNLSASELEEFAQANLHRLNRKTPDDKRRTTHH